jgi:hypothetical protein
MPYFAITRVALVLTACLASIGGLADELPRVEVTPLPRQIIEMAIDGQERAAWHFSSDAPRPFFFPFCSPDGAWLTRMGHPGAENHDHHLSIWFAHHDVDGQSFWQDESGCTIRQQFWMVQNSGDEEGVLAVRLLWLGATETPLLEHDMVASLRPEEAGEHTFEIQSTFRPAAGRQLVTLGKTNFGFLAVRVAASISTFFGAGRIVDSEGREGEPDIFGERAAWVDYSGSVGVGVGSQRRAEAAGLTFIDHPENPRYPTRWHVRSDGWMGASFCFDDAYEVSAATPLTLRYLLYAHRGTAADAAIAAKMRAFHARRGWDVRPAASGEPHRQWVVTRRDGTESLDAP